MHHRAARKAEGEQPERRTLQEVAPTLGPVTGRIGRFRAVAFQRPRGELPGDLEGLGPVLPVFGGQAPPPLKEVLAGCPGPRQRANVATFFGLAAERQGALDLARASYRAAAACPDRTLASVFWAELRLAQLER